MCDILEDEWRGVCMEEIIVVRAIDADGTIFQTIMAALRDKSVQTVDVSSDILSFGDVKIYPAFRRVLKAGKEIHLNYGEYSMLYCLVKHPGRVFTKEQIYTHVWNNEYSYDDRNIMSFVSKLRKKIKNEKLDIDYIQTIHGIGYRFCLGV